VGKSKYHVFTPMLLTESGCNKKFTRNQSDEN